MHMYLLKSVVRSQITLLQLHYCISIAHPAIVGRHLISVASVHQYRLCTLTLAARSYLGIDNDLRNPKDAFFQRGQPIIN